MLSLDAVGGLEELEDEWGLDEGDGGGDEEPEPEPESVDDIN